MHDERGKCQATDEHRIPVENARIEAAWVQVSP